MKKWAPASAFTLLLLGLWVIHKTRPAEVTTVEDKVKLVAAKSIRPAPPMKMNGSSRQVSKVENRHPVEHSERPLNFRKNPKRRKKTSVLEEATLSLPDGLILSKDIRAVKAGSYNPAMGPILRERNGVVFFKHEAASTVEVARVVYDSANDAFYPLSAVIKVEGATHRLRGELESRGFEVYYYQEKLKLLYLQSSHSQLIDLYQDLKSQGLLAHLEVVRGHHKKR